MSNSRVYLDHNASTALYKAAHASMLEVMELVGNPSSVHGEGRVLANIIEKSRSEVADIAGADRNQIVFTGSASEAITQAIVGSVTQLGVKKIFMSAGEHQAVVSAAKISGAEIEIIGLDENGVIDVAALEHALTQHERFKSAGLICVHMVNGETGIIQPIEKTEKLVAQTDHFLFVDAVQAFGKMQIDFVSRDIDMLAISAHKMGGPTGVGALLMKERCFDAKIIPGGGQEMGRRGGTASAMLIAGFGAASGEALRRFDLKKLQKLIEKFETGLMQLDENIVIFGRDAKRIGNVSFFALPGNFSETALIKLDLNGIAVSAGSACSSGKAEISPMLKAMGIAPELAQCALRVSVGWNSSEADIERALEEIKKLIIGQQRENTQITPPIGRS
ncbi:MAG: cysteine desulfurase [Devosiaceae bacterium]|nr:cysteine desulfurase [Devosiaceae bacterium]